MFFRSRPTPRLFATCSGVFSCSNHAEPLDDDFDDDQFDPEPSEDNFDNFDNLDESDETDPPEELWDEGDWE